MTGSIVVMRSGKSLERRLISTEYAFCETTSFDLPQNQIRPAVRVETGERPRMRTTGEPFAGADRLAESFSSSPEPLRSSAAYHHSDGTGRPAVAYQAARSNAQAAFCVSGRG